MEGHEIVGYRVNADGFRVLLLRSGSFVWSPPEAAENVAVEELRRARHKTQSFLHIYICLKRLKYIGGSESFTRQQADLVVAIKAGNLTGIKPNMNHPSLVFVLPTYLLAHGRSEISPPFWMWEGYFVEREGTMKAPKGIFCGNSAYKRNPWSPRHQS